jgi:hypothetical protein
MKYLFDTIYTGTTIWSNGWQDVRCNMWKAETNSMHSRNVHSSRMRPCQRNALHRSRTLRFLHNQRWQNRLLQHLQNRLGWLLRWRASPMGLRSSSNRCTSFVNSHGESHHRGWSFCAHCRGLKVCCSTIPPVT